MPRTREALEALPGVGRKTANVVLNMAFGEPTIAVDTHIFRVANRTGLAPGKTPLEVEDEADEASCRPNSCADAHHWLILHGRYVCMARKPLCCACAVAALLRLPAEDAAAGAALIDSVSANRSKWFWRQVLAGSRLTLLSSSAGPCPRRGHP